MSADHWVEQIIIDRLLDDLLTGGWMISVNDGEETTLWHSKDKAEILRHMQSTDEDYLHVAHPNRKKGWIRLIYGNGVNLISDYTVNLDDVLAPISELIEINGY